MTDLTLTFLRALWPDPTGLLAAFTLPSKATLCADSAEGIAAAVLPYLDSENIYIRATSLKSVPPAGGRADASLSFAMPGIWADIDILGPAHKAKDLPPDLDAALDIANCTELKPSLIVHSGNGIQAWWLFREPLIFEDETYIRALSDLVHRWQTILSNHAKKSGYRIDATHDLARVMRLPGTFNRKDPNNPKPVTFTNSWIRHDPSDFLLIVPPVRVLVPSLSAAVAVKREFLPVPIAPILKGCAWMRHCQDDATTLPEPEWYQMLTVVARCRDAEDLAHSLSSPYPNYSHRETAEKLAHADSKGPVTCAYVESSLGFAGCGSCPSRARVKSPISITPAPPNLWRGVDMAAALPPGEADQWPDPLPLPDVLPGVDALDPELLPGPLRAMAEELARSMDCPLELPAAALMCTLAGAVNRRALISPKQYGEWVVVPNLWGLIVAPAGFKKSPILSACTAPLVKLEAERRERRTEENKAAAAELEEFSFRKKAWEDKATAAAKKGDPMPDGKPEPPTVSVEGARLIVMDSTAEKLQELLRDHPAGLLTVRDEVGGFMAELSKKGRESDRGFYLTAWAGDQSYAVDRITRGEIHVPHCCLSFIGAIQPVILQGLMATATANGGGDGLMARFQMAFWPDFRKGFEYRDERADRPTRYAVEKLMTDLVAIDHKHPLRLRFDSEAQELFREFLTDIETRARAEENPAFASHLSKFASLMPTLAALIHLGEEFKYEIVTLDSAQRAAAWCRTLESHARRIYQSALRPEMAAAIALGKRIQKGELVEGGIISARAIYRRHLADLNTPELVKAAMESLESLDWVRPVQGQNTGGRPALHWAVNPALLR